MKLNTDDAGISDAQHLKNLRDRLRTCQEQARKFTDRAEFFKAKSDRYSLEREAFQRNEARGWSARADGLREEIKAFEAALAAMVEDEQQQPDFRLQPSDRSEHSQDD